MLLLRDIQTTLSLHLCLACPWSRSQLFFISCCFIVSLSFMDGFLVERRKDSSSNGWKEIYSGVYIHSCVCLSGKIVLFKTLALRGRQLTYNNKIYKGTRNMEKIIHTHLRANIHVKKDLCALLCMHKC